MKRKVKVKTEKTVNTFAHFRTVSWLSLQEAKQKKEGWFYQCMISQLFSAFCLEAYLYHVGQKKLAYWEKVERKLGPREKLEIITCEIGFKPDFGKRPFQSLDLIFTLRNLLVHGRTDYLEEENEQILDEAEKPKLPQAKWEKLINLEKAIVFSEDTKAIIEAINSKAGFKINLLYAPETGGWSVSPIEND